jgi:hypothetical protein
MPFTQFTNLDFDDIKTSIKDYIRANSNFTDFDFEGSNLSALIDILAYNTYITAFNSNMIVNESFLDSATLRENVVALARNIGYVPRSRTASKAIISFQVQTSSTSPTCTLEAGLVCIGDINDSTYLFSIPESITTTINNGVATFQDITVYQGSYLTNQFLVDGSLDQRFILDNAYIDTSTIKVFVKGVADTGKGREYTLIQSILNNNSTSETYLIQEIKDEKYQLLFGDGIFGKKLENNTIISASYIVTDGSDGNGARNFSFSGRLLGSENEVILPLSTSSVNITTTQASINGGDIESVDSIKYFAPRLYASNYRAVTARDYESIVREIYPNTESVSIVGGEELDPPQFGNVIISIKPKNGDFISDFDKRQILAKLKNYSLSGINQSIVDLSVLYVEIDTYVYYNPAKVSNIEDLKTNISSSITLYSQSSDVNKFGGRFRYSKVVKLIDSVDESITSNITKVKMRRNLRASINQYAQYELCFGNQFHIDPKGYNIKSTGFTLIGDSSIVYLTDIPNKDSNGNLDGSGKGVISIVRESEDVGQPIVVVKSAGTVDYISGEILLNTLNISSTIETNNIIEVQAYPESNDVIGLKDLYLSFNIDNSTINMVKDTITSGEQISGVGFKVTSSYSNGDLKRV